MSICCKLQSNVTTQLGRNVGKSYKVQPKYLIKLQQECFNSINWYNGVAQKVLNYFLHESKLISSQSLCTILRQKLTLNQKTKLECRLQLEFLDSKAWDAN